MGSGSVSLHLILETLAFYLGFRYYTRLRARSEDVISDMNRLWILIGATLGAFIGSRLLGALEYPAAWRASAYPLLYFFRAKTIVGGLAGGLWGVEITKKIVGEKASSGDLFTFPLILAMMIGRVGCFSSGVYEPTYGVETTLPWGMNLGDGVLRHPVALYEIIFLGCLWLFLSGVGFKKQANQPVFLVSGARFKLFMLAYFAFRFGIDFIKPVSFRVVGLSSIQITCILVYLYYAKSIYNLIDNPKTWLHHG